MGDVAQRIRVTGVVQGVGFRPFVWHLAQELSLSGWVRNDALGVDILAQGAAEQVQALIARLRSEAPPLARVERIDAATAAPSPACSGFTIAPSVGGAVATAIGVDVGVCPDCLGELFNPEGRRWRHAFITCTHCGPRFGVATGLPYDRSRTTLAPFALCPDCQAEYTQPSDRRFHAETTCCPHCGPQLRLLHTDGEPLAGDPITQTLALLRQGSIVAIKGLGGFHLACDATNAKAVQRLRMRKHREAKPFALMACNRASLVPWVAVSAEEAALLDSPERPIVLLAQHRSDALPGVAPGLAQLGALLPVTPIHYLLFHEAAGRPAGTGWLQQAQPLLLVMTSANPGGEPMVTESGEARARLGGIADALLDHDRGIAASCDDSVLRVVDGHSAFLRRSRGYAPSAIALPRMGSAGAGQNVLAWGAYLKTTVCATRGSAAYLSPHVGDLDNAATCRFLEDTAQRLLDLLQLRPDAVAHDLQPDCHSTHAAQAFAAAHGLPCVGVQHHHAHIAATCAEHGHRGPVLGLALDGHGLGSDGTAWGGELLRVDGAGMRRIGHLRALPLPGGERAAREPWRMGAAALQLLQRGDEIPQRWAGLREAPGVAQLLQRGVRCPPSTSAGRWFDAAAALLGLCTHMDYEAQAAMRLEQAAQAHIARHGWPQPLEVRTGCVGAIHYGQPGENQRRQGPSLPDWPPYDLASEPVNGLSQLDLLPLLDALSHAPDPGWGAALFHATLADTLEHWVVAHAQALGLDTVALGGGCFANALLSSRLGRHLHRRGLRVLHPQRVGAGDGGLALGQAWVAQQFLENPNHASCALA
ncbi:MAG: carbamoyltransferase HypF [Rhodoferax sp.]